VLLLLKEPSPAKILVYKGEDENNMKITGSIHAGMVQWADSNLLPGTRYYYFLVKLDDKGERTMLGSIKNIDF
jgi:hypothetical protein